MAFDPEAYLQENSSSFGTKMDISPAPATSSFDPEQYATQSLEEIAAHPDFNPEVFAAQNPEHHDFAYEADKKKNERSIGQKLKEIKPLQAGAGAFHGMVNFVAGLPTIAGNLGQQVYYGATGNPELKTKQAEFMTAIQSAEQQTKELFQATAGNALPIMDEQDKLDKAKREFQANNPTATTEELVNHLKSLMPQLEEDARKEDFKRRVENARTNLSLEAGRPVDTGLVAQGYKAIGDAVGVGSNPSEDFSPEALKAEGASQVDLDNVHRAAAFANPVNVALAAAPMLPGSQLVGGAATKYAGKVLQAPMDGLIGGVKIAKKLGLKNKVATTAAITSAGTAALMEAPTIISAAMHGGKAVLGGIALGTGLKGLQKIGQVMEAQGGEMMTGAPSNLTARAATARVTGQGDARAVIGMKAGNAIATGAATAAGFAPVNAALSEGDPQKMLESTLGAGVLGSTFAAFKTNRPAIVEGIRPYWRSEGARTMDATTETGKKSLDYIFSLPEESQHRIFETMGVLQGIATEGPEGGKGTSQFRPMREADYLAELAKEPGGKANEGGRGYFRHENGEVIINADATNSIGDVIHTMGHEGAHAVVGMMRAAGDKGGAIWDGVVKEAKKGLFDKSGKPNEKFLSFIAEYNKAFDPSGKTQRLRPSDPLALEEFLAEQSGRILSGEGLDYSVPKSLAERIEQSVGRFAARTLGMDTRKVGEVGVQTSFLNKDEIGSVTEAMRETLKQVAQMPRVTPPEEAAPGQPAGPAPAPVAPTPAPRRTVEEMIADALGGRPEDYASAPAPAAPAPAPATPEVPKNSSSFETKMQNPAQGALADPVLPGEFPKEGYTAVQNGPVLPPGASPEPVSAPEGALAPEAAQRAITGEDLAARVTAAENAAVQTPEFSRKRNDVTRAKMRQQARVGAILEAAHETAGGIDDLQRRTDPEGGERFTGKLDPENPVHKALLDELGVQPDGRATISLLNNEVGKTVFLDYKSAPKESPEDISGTQRAEELRKSTAEDRRTGGESLEQKGKAFHLLGFKVWPKESSLTVFGFSPDKWITNAGKLIEHLKAEGRPSGYESVNDPKLPKDTQAYTANHENGWKGDGSGPVKGITQKGEPIPIPRDRFDVLNAALNFDVSTKSGSKREGTQRGALEAQELARENDWGIDAETGDTNPLRAYINKSGKLITPSEKGDRVGTGANLERVFEHISPDLVTNISETPVSQELVRPVGFKGNPGEAVEKGIPNTTWAKAGFMPKQSGALFMPSENSSSRETKMQKGALSEPPVDKLGFYSGLRKAIEAKLPNRASPEQVLGSLGEFTVLKTIKAEKEGEKDRTEVVGKYGIADKASAEAKVKELGKDGKLAFQGKQQGVTLEELEVLGLPQFLEGKKNVTKQEVLDFLDQNGPRLKEIVRGVETMENLTESEQARLKELYLIPKRTESEIEEQNHLSAKARPDAKFNRPDLVLPGGENYKERLITLPEKNDQFYSSFNEYFKAKYAEYSDPSHPAYVMAKSRASDAWESMDGKIEVDDFSGARVGRSTGNYISSHFPDETNIVAHTRETDHEDVTGSKVRVLQEVQSDFHQEGKKSGYRKALTKEEAARFEELKKQERQIDKALADERRQPTAEEIKDPNFDVLKFVDAQGERPEMKALQEQFNQVHAERLELERKSTSGVPDAPFKKNWHELAFKRALAGAIQDGMDKIAWTTGETQNERYNLAKHVDDITYLKQADGDYMIQAGKKGSVVFQDAFGPKELSGVVGEEIANKIISGDGRESIEGTGAKVLTGLDLKVGGSGMKGFYDKILPDFVRKYIKPWGGKVETTQLKDPREPEIIETRGAYRVVDGDGEQVGPGFITEAQADAYINDNWKELNPPGATVHSVTINEAMRQAVQKGQPLFMPSEGKPEGALKNSSSFETKMQKPKGALVEPPPVDELGFYSGLRKAVMDRLPNKASVDQVKATLDPSKGGIKKEELEVMGLPQFLEGKTHVTKKELVDFIDANSIKIKEVEKGGDSEIARKAGSAREELEQMESELEVYTDEGNEMDWNSEHGDSDELAQKAAEEYADERGLEFKRSALGWRVTDENGRTVKEFKEHDFGGLKAADEHSKGIKELEKAIREKRKEVEELESKVGGAEAKFQDYSTEGGENYREILYQLPIKDRPATSEIELYYKLRSAKSHGTPEEFQALGGQDKLDALNEKIMDNNDASMRGDRYKSAHWDELNVLGHTRIQDFQVQGVGHVRLVDEVQSDWHQAGRETGYKGKGQGESPELTKLRQEMAELQPQGYKYIQARESLNEFMDRVHKKYGYFDSNEKWSPEETLEQGKLKREMLDSEESYRRSNELNAKIKEQEVIQKRKVPDAPFKKNWHELLFKRELRRAIDEGADAIAWPAGEVHAERFDLSKQISRVSYEPEDFGDYSAGTLYAFDKNGRQVMRETGVEPHQFKDYIGEEPAKKLKNEIASKEYALKQWEVSFDEEEGGWLLHDANGEAVHDRGGGLEVFTSEKAARNHIEELERETGHPEISGLDLKVGGEGMKGFYDKILPDFVRKYVKPWGGKVEQINLSADHDASFDKEREWNRATAESILDRGGEVYVVDQHGHENNISSTEELETFLEDNKPRGYITGDVGGKIPAHSVKITDEMRSAIKSGQPLFMPGEKGNKGALAEDEKNSSSRETKMRIPRRDGKKEVMDSLEQEGALSTPRSDDSESRIKDIEREREAEAYFSIGHEGGASNWIYDPSSRTVKAKKGGTHGVNFGHDVADRSFKGWYDPDRDVISVAFPESARRKLEGAPTVDDIPTDVYKKLQSKFGKEAAMVAFMPSEAGGENSSSFETKMEKKGALAGGPKDFLAIARARAKEAQSHEPDKEHARLFEGLPPEKIEDARSVTGASQGGAGEEFVRAGSSGQARAFLKWAGENQAVVKNLPERTGGGSEHSTRTIGGRVVKSTIGGRFGGIIALDDAGGVIVRGATPSEYLDRIKLANDLFGDDVRLVGAHISPDGVSVVTSQKLLDGKNAKISEADAFMTDKGFVRVRPFEYYSPEMNVAAFDVRGSNFIKDAEGDVHPIDLMLSQPEGELKTALEKDATDGYKGPLVDYGNGKKFMPVDTSSKEFQRFFKGSVVKDNDGEPLTVFHGGTFNLEEFNHDEPAVFHSDAEGVHFGTEGAALERIGGKQVDDLVKSIDLHEDENGRWHYDIDGMESMEEDGYATKEEANEAAEQEAVSIGQNSDIPEEAANITKVYLSLKNPVRLPDLGTWGISDVIRNLSKKSVLSSEEVERISDLIRSGKMGDDWSALKDTLKTKGYDGIVYKNEHEDKGKDSYVVFDSNQIKSADQNTGAFDPSNPDIRFMPKEDESSDRPEDHFSKSMAEDIFKRVWNAQLRDYFDDPDAPNDPKNWKDWVDQWETDQIAPAIDSSSEIYDRFFAKNPNVSAYDLVDAYKKGSLPDQVAAKGKKGALALSELEFKREGRIGEPAASVAPEELKSLWETANQRPMKKNKEAVMEARKQILMQAHTQDVNAQLGLTPKELNKAMRSWSAYPAAARDLHASLNHGVPEVSKWSGIPNSSFISNATVNPEDIASMVKKIEAPEGSGWHSPTAESVRRFLARAFLSIDTRIDFGDLTVKVETKPDAYLSKTVNGTYSSNDRTIRLRVNSANTMAHELGHYLDHKWASEIGMDTQLLSDAKFDSGIAEGKTSKERIEWSERFQEFVNDLSDRGDTYSEYTQSRREVFARFVDQFVRWTGKQAGARQREEHSGRDDKFQTRDFHGFVKLLQEKAFVDAKDGNPLGIKRANSKDDMRFMPGEAKKIKIERWSEDDDSNTEDPWELAEKAEKAFRASGIRPASNKELSLIAYDKDGEPIGATYSKTIDADAEEFGGPEGDTVRVHDFDLGVDPKAQSGTVGYMLAKRAIQEARHDDADLIRLWVINPKMADMLEKFFGFEHESEPETREGYSTSMTLWLSDAKAKEMKGLPKFMPKGKGALASPGKRSNLRAPVAVLANGDDEGDEE